MSHRGLVRSLGKRVYQKYREFESPHLRHTKIQNILKKLVTSEKHFKIK